MTQIPLEDQAFQLARLSPFARLLERRIVFLRGALEETTADDLAAQLLCLEMDSDEPVTLYIDSPGGSSSGMFALYDTIQLMRAPVHTTCIGMAASAGAFLLATGTGVRSATPNAWVMIHQPRGQGPWIGGRHPDSCEPDRLPAPPPGGDPAERTGRTLARIHEDTQRTSVVGRRGTGLRPGRRGGERR